MKKPLLIFIAIIGLIAKAYPQIPSYVPSNGLVSWWPFTGNANDSSGNGNNGIVNGASLTSDRFGIANSAYSFDGINNYINYGNILSMNGQQQLTISIWFNANSNVFYSRLIGKEQDGNNTDGFDLQFDTNTGNTLATNVRTTGSAGATDTNAIVFGQWYHVVAVFDGNGLNNSDRFKLYLNGTLQIETYSGTIPTLTSTNNFECWIGGIYPNPTMNPWNGKLDDIGIWNRALTECEVLDLYNAQLNSATGISAGNDVTVCEGDLITLSGSGGSNYQWSGGISDAVPFTVITSQTYFLTGENMQGCTGTDTIFVNVNQLPSVNAGNDQTICEGDQVTLTGTGSATSYVWDNSVTDGVAFNPAGTLTYTVTGTDVNNCENSDQMTVIVNSHTSSIVNESGVDSVNVNGIWYTQNGQYTQVIPNAANCDSTITINVSLTFTGINELVSDGFTIYPNPTSGKVTIKISHNIVGSNYFIYDSQGKSVFTGIVASENINIDLGDLSNGIYLFRIGENLKQTFKVIKE